MHIGNKQQRLRIHGISDYDRQIQFNAIVSKYDSLLSVDRSINVFIVVSKAISLVL